MGLGLGTMRRVVIEMGALLALSGLLGCAGGQTGEITEPSECDAIAETLAFEALPEEARAELEALSGPWREALAWDALLEAGWPGQKVRAESGAHRVRVAVSTLRKLGLADVIETVEEGYRLDPEVPVERSG